MSEILELDPEAIDPSGLRARAETENDPVNHPSHYTWMPNNIEVIDITEHLNFCRGNAVKYILRSGRKGSTIEDLKKAVWYLEREISRVERWRNR